MGGSRKSLRRNGKDLEEIPESARKDLKFVWLDSWMTPSTPPSWGRPVSRLKNQAPDIHTSQGRAIALLPHGKLRTHNEERIVKSHNTPVSGIDLAGERWNIQYLLA